MCKKASAKPYNYTKAVDAKDAWIYVNSVYKYASGNDKDATESVLRHIVFVC